MRIYDHAPQGHHHMNFSQKYRCTIDGVSGCASADNSLLPNELAPGKAGIRAGLVVCAAHHGHYKVHLHAHSWTDE